MVSLAWVGDYRLFTAIQKPKQFNPMPRIICRTLRQEGVMAEKNKGEKQIRSRREMLNKLIVYLLLLKDYLLQSTN